MTGSKPRTSGIGSNRSTNWATPLPNFIACYKSKFKPFGQSYNASYQLNYDSRVIHYSIPSIRYVSRAIIFNCRAFITLATGLADH